MSKLYQKSSPISTPFSNIYSNIFSHFFSFYSFMPLPFINFLPSFVISILRKESVSFDDLASFLAPHYNINFDSASKKIKRFLSNSNYDFDYFFNSFISHIFSSFKIKHSDKRVHIAFDHMDIKDNFTVLMFVLKIGKRSIPLWFKSFPFHDESAYTFDLFKEGISFCHNLIKSVDPDSNIIFLADRFWANHFKLMDFIDSLGDTFCIRAKGNLLVYTFDQKEGHIIRKRLDSLNKLKYHSKFYSNIACTNKRHHLNIAISDSINHNEPFYILTNGDPKRAIKDYSYRFGSIEFEFKNQKSNGFYANDSQIKDLFTFNSLYTCICIASILATITGIDYSKNSNCYKDYKIKTSRIVNGKRRKDISFFRVGLILLEYCFNSPKPLNLFKRLILYDV